MIQINLRIASTSSSELSSDETQAFRKFVIGSLWYPDADVRALNPEGKFNRIAFELSDPDFTIMDITRKFRRMKRKFRRRFPGFCMSIDIHDQQLVNF